MLLNVVTKCMVGQEQMDYRFQLGFNRLEDKFGLNTKMASKTVEFHREEPLVWPFVRLRLSV